MYNAYKNICVQQLFWGGFPSVCHHARLADDGIVSLFKPSKEIIGLSSGVQIH